MTATIGVARDLDTVPGDNRVARPARWLARLPWILLVLCAVLFVYGERTIPGAVASQWGLIAVASPAYGLSILLTAVAFAIAVRQSNMKAAVAATVLIVIVQRLPRSIATDMPMYAWTYKHLAVTDYIQHAHTLARDVDIYNGWPGLFGLTAWFSDLTGVSPVDIAHWFTQFFYVLFAVLVYAVARAWDLKPLTAITATFLLLSLNWVEQDYFAPQTMSMILAAGILALIGLSRERAVAIWLIIVLFTAITITHQLTPAWLLMLMGLLILGRRLKPWWIVIPLAAIFVAFIIYNWEQVSYFELFSVDLAKNTETNVQRLGATAVLGQRVLSYSVRTLSVVLWAGTGLTLLYRWRRQKKPIWALGVLALCPLLIVSVNNYGGEAPFRSYLYGLMGCCVVLAPVLVSALQAIKWRWFVTGLVTLLLAVSASTFGNTGGWYANVMPRNQVIAARLVLEQAELPAYMTSVAPSWPERVSWRYVDYARFNRSYDVPMVFATELLRRHYDTDADYEKFVDALNSRPDASTYMIWTEQSRVYTWYFGILPWDALPNLDARVRNDPTRWEPLFVGEGIHVYVHRVRPILSPQAEQGKLGQGFVARLPAIAQLPPPTDAQKPPPR